MSSIRFIYLALFLTFMLPAPAGAWTSRNRKAKSAPTVVVLTSSSNWLVPANFNSGKNSIECIGGGGGGGTGSGTTGSFGGGGGGYAKRINAALTPGSTVKYVIGGGGAANTDGGESYFCNSTANCANSAGTAVIVRVGGGSSGVSTYSGSGAPSSHAIGNIGPTGGSGFYGETGGGGGGGAAGPAGMGGSAGAEIWSANGGGGGGGGGNGGGRAGFANFATNRGGAGGANSLGLGGGGGGNASVGGAGTNGGGGGGGGINFAGGAGGAGTDLTGTIGSGGGGGGGGSAGGKAGGAGGLYGGGGGAGGISGTGGTGAAGVCVIKYGGDVSETGSIISAMQEGEVYVNTSSPSFAITYGRPPNAGNLVLCWIEYQSSSYTIAGVSDNAGNTFTKAVNTFRNPSMLGGAYWDEVWYAKNVAHSNVASYTVTATQSASTAQDRAMYCTEYKGADPANPFVDAKTAIGSGTAITVGPTTLPVGNMLVITGGGNGGGKQTPPLGFMIHSRVNGSMYADGIVNAPGAYSATWKIDTSVQFQSWMLILRSR